MSAADILARALAACTAQDLPDGQRTERYTLDGVTWHRLTPGQYASLIAVTPPGIRELNQAPRQAPRQETRT